MHITAAGLARIKTLEFLLMMQQLPQDYAAIAFLAVGVCSDEDGTLTISAADELGDFIRSHRDQLIDLMMEVQDDVLALPNSMWA
jgi:hypothetical protein